MNPGSMYINFYSSLLIRVFSVSMFVGLFNNDSFGQVNVIMNHNNLQRTGWNNNETILATDNVSSGNFGKLFSREVDDEIYAQPLVLSNVPIGGGTHNIVLVATVNNTLYAFDADDPNTSTSYWQDNLTFDPVNFRPVRNSDMTGACGGNYKDFSGKMGIVGTPAIDIITNTLYVVSRSVSQTGTPAFVQYLHAINISTGAERSGSPVLISATYPGNGDGNTGGILTFNAQRQNQRTGLLLYNGVIYIEWASHCDWGPYQGWMMGYNAQTLQQEYVYNTAANGSEAGIWMSGQPPAVDQNGNFYIATGNGTTGQNGNANDTINRGSSLLKLYISSGKLKVKDFFTPMNYQYLNNYDLDYGVDGVLLIPDTHLSLSGSKEGHLFLINNDQMGGTTSDNSNVLQTLNVTNENISNTRHLHGSPVYFKDEYNNEYIYAWAEGSLLIQFPFSRSSLLFDTINAKTGNTVLPGGMPGAMLSVSSNGSQHGTGILWANHPIHGNANQAVVPGVLQAFDATDVTHELWNSNWNSKRDSIGKFAKFVFPTIANGKVYMATFSHKLNVYGLNPPPASPCTATLPPGWQSADIGYVAYPGDVCVNNSAYTLTASGDDIWNSADAFHYLFQMVITDETELTIRVTSIKNTSTYAKCGIMFRQNLDPGSPYVFLSLSPSNNIYFQKRTTQNSIAVNIDSPITKSLPYFIRIYNTGNKYISSYSPNGTDWTILDSTTLAMGTNPYVGIAYTTRNNTVLDTAIVDNVSLRISGALSVNLLSFKGKNLNDHTTLLNWTTSGEINTDHFEIQRSGPFTDFKTIGILKGNGTTSQPFTYTFSDNFPKDGNNFYRLKVEDNNGNISYSSIVEVRFNFDKIIIYPNPAHDKIFVRNNDNFSKGENVTVQLLDFNGKVLFKKQFKTNGVSILTFNIPPKIINGMYVIVVINGDGERQGDEIFIKR